LYEKFFGFHRAPFELVPDPDFLFLGESHDSALANLVIGIDSGKGFVAVSGPVGTGKTTILRALLRRLGRNQNVCFLSQPEGTVKDLLSSILYGFGVSAQGLEEVELRRRIRALLERTDKPGILIVDEAHLLTVDALEQIRLLSNLEEENRKLLQIVLAGQPELNELLSRKRLQPLTQRIEMFYKIEALSLEETRAYIERRIRVAGNPSGLVFEPEAIERIHHHTGGVPRLINILADRCLITAYVDESRKITERIVREAFEDLGEVTQSVMPGGRVNGNPLAEKPAPPGETFRSPLREERGEVDEAMPTGVLEARTPKWREPYVKTQRGVPPPAAEKTKGASRAGQPARERVDRYFAMSGIIALIVIALVSLGSRGLPMILGTAGESDHPKTVSPRDDETSLAAPREQALPAPEFTREEGKGSIVSGELDSARGSLTGLTGGASVPSVWSVHVASFRELPQAEKFVEALRQKISETVRISPAEVDTGLWYRILVGEFASEEEADAHRAELRETHGFSFLQSVRLGHPEDTSFPPSR
jgi:type II secretory pathway predicted ATPase ExeA